MNIHCAHVTGIFLAPDHLQKGRAAVDLAGMCRQKFEQFELLSGVFELLILKGDAAVVQVHAQVANLYDIFGHRLLLPRT